MESRLKTPWFSVLGLILFGIAGARVLFIRGQQVSTENIPRFHVTPVLLHALKTNGDVAFFGFAILGIAAGFDAAVFEAQSDNETIAVFTGLGKAGIVTRALMISRHACTPHGCRVCGHLHRDSGERRKDCKSHRVTHKSRRLVGGYNRIENLQKADTYRLT